jgi:ribosomal protein S18 acetylase RimI-like enzyme
MANKERIMTIRVANINDIDGILKLEEQMMTLHAEARPDWIDKNKKSFDNEYMKNIIENNNGDKIFVVEENEKIIGHCITRIRPIKGHPILYDMINIEIDDLCIDGNYRHKGIGKKLFEEVKKYAKEKNIKTIELGVWEFNTNAKMFYEHIGMKVRHCRMEYKIE